MSAEAAGERSADAEAFERCMSVGGIAVFPADTVYGLACDPNDRVAVERLYALKRRPLAKPSAVMFFDLELALESLPELGERTRGAMEPLLPGPVSLLLPNPAKRFALTCGEDPTTLGIRVPHVPMLEGVSWPVLQSSANLAGGPEARRLADVPEDLRRRADLVIDGGELPGTSSTVIDLRDFEQDGAWSVVRQGAVAEAELMAVLGDVAHFDPKTYAGVIRQEIDAYERLQDELVAASGSGARRILELGTGTGETARRLLERHPEAALTGVDVSAEMLDAARATLPAGRVELRVGRLQDKLPEGPFDLVASALAIHHLDGAEKADLFRRVRAVLAPGGRFVLADVVESRDPSDAHIELTPGYDKPSSVADQLRWLTDAGFDPEVAWERDDLAVIVADATPAGIVGGR